MLISEAVPERHAVPLHKCSPASPPAQESRPSSGRHHAGALQHGGCGFFSVLLFLLARVPQWLPRPRPPPTHNACPKLHAREGEWTWLMTLIPKVLIFTNVLLFFFLLSPNFWIVLKQSSFSLSNVFMYFLHLEWNMTIFLPGFVRFSCIQICPIHPFWMMSWVQSCSVNMQVMSCLCLFQPYTGPAIVFSGSVPYRERPALLQTVQWKPSAGNLEVIAAHHTCRTAKPRPILLKDADHCFGGRVLPFARGQPEISAAACFWEPQGFVRQLLLCLFQLDFTRLPMIQRPKWMFYSCCRETHPKSADVIQSAALRVLRSLESEQCFLHCLFF